MNPKLSGLAAAVIALASVFSNNLLAHEGHGHATQPGHSFEEGSRPDGPVSRGPAGGGEHVGKERPRPPENGQDTQPIPEPETYAMMLAGLGVLVAAMRRRGQK